MEWQTSVMADSGDGAPPFGLVWRSFVAGHAEQMEPASQSSLSVATAVHRATATNWVKVKHSSRLDSIAIRCGSMRFEGGIAIETEPLINAEVKAASELGSTAQHANRVEQETQYAQDGGGWKTSGSLRTRNKKHARWIRANDGTSAHTRLARTAAAEESDKFGGRWSTRCAFNWSICLLKVDGRWSIDDGY